LLTQQLLLQLVVILAVVQICGYLAGLIGQQWVIGEIIAGIALGPTLFGTLFPGLSYQIFPPSALPTLQALGDIGLVLYMFTVGTLLSMCAEVWHGNQAAMGGETGCTLVMSSVKKRMAACTNSSMLPARRLAATALFIRPHTRSTGLSSWAA